MKNLAPGAHIHLIGICGTAMASLAGILKELGYVLSGSDQNVYPPMSTQLERLGITIQSGFRAENLSPRPDLVIVGNVVSRTNPEVVALLGSEIPYTSLPKALGEFVIGERASLVVAGTHGKTTTTSLLAWVTDALQLDAGFLIGGIPINYGLSFRAPKSNYFVIEGDEYDTAFFDKVPKFIHYRPRHVILTSVEFDHADIYQDLAAVKQAFTQLLLRIPEDGTLIFNGEDANIRTILPACRARHQLSYGLKTGDYHIDSRSIKNGFNQIMVRQAAKQKVTPLSLQIFGEHNSLNALAVYALADVLKWPQDKVLLGLHSFLGVKRRQEWLGEVQGVTVIEDFAHHPTAVDLTLKCMRERYPGRRLLAVFEPRSATSRRRVFQQDYTRAFKNADLTFIAQPFDQSKIEEQHRFSTAELITDLRASGKIAESAANAQALVELIGQQAKPNDVVLVMSNGGFDGIYEKLFQRLSLAT